MKLTVEQTITLQIKDISISYQVLNNQMISLKELFMIANIIFTDSNIKV